MKVRVVARASSEGGDEGYDVLRPLGTGVVGAHSDLEANLFTRRNDDVDDAGQFR